MYSLAPENRVKFGIFNGKYSGYEIKFNSLKEI